MLTTKLTVSALLASLLLCGTAVAESNARRVPASPPPCGPSVLVASSPIDSSPIDDREVYIITSKLRGTLPKLGPIRHASIAICPRGASPIAYENGVPVSNCAECLFYGTQLMQRGFRPEKKRIDVTATKVCGISAATVERRMRSHWALNVPVLNDCRHHVIQVLGIRNRFGNFRRPITLK